MQRSSRYLLAEWSGSPLKKSRQGEPAKPLGWTDAYVTFPTKAHQWVGPLSRYNPGCLVSLRTQCAALAWGGVPSILKSPIFCLAFVGSRIIVGCIHHRSPNSEQVLHAGQRIAGNGTCSVCT